MRIVRLLGQGASGVVQKAFIPRESRFVAVKKISVLERDKRHQLMNDIKALCNAPDMPGLIRFFGAYLAADKGQIAVVLEYVDGGSLADVLQKVGAAWGLAGGEGCLGAGGAGRPGSLGLVGHLCAWLWLAGWVRRLAWGGIKAAGEAGSGQRPAGWLGGDGQAGGTCCGLCR